MISIVCYYNVLSNWRNLILIIRSAPGRKGELRGSEFMITAWSFTWHKFSLLRESPWRNIMCRGSYRRGRSKGKGGAQEDRPPFILGTNWGPKGWKKYFVRPPPPPPPPLSKGMDDCPAPLIPRSGSATVQWCWRLKKSSMRDATRITPFAWEHLRPWLLMWLLLCLHPVGASSWQLKYHHGMVVQILMPLFASNKTLLSQLCSMSIVHQLSLSYLKGMLP